MSPTTGTSSTASRTLRACASWPATWARHGYTAPGAARSREPAGCTVRWRFGRTVPAAPARPTTSPSPWSSWTALWIVALDASKRLLSRAVDGNAAPGARSPLIPGARHAGGHVLGHAHADVSQRCQQGDRSAGDLRSARERCARGDVGGVVGVGRLARLAVGCDQRGPDNDRFAFRQAEQRGDLGAGGSLPCLGDALPAPAAVRPQLGSSGSRGLASSVPAARQFVGDTLAGWGVVESGGTCGSVPRSSPRTRYCTALLRAGISTFALCVSRAGLGLWLVKEVADEFGVFGERAGKTVWVALRV